MEDLTALDWSLVQAFLAVAETGSLSAAARALGRSQPTLGRQIKAIEDQLGADLFHRQPRGFSLTDDGQALIEPARTMREAANRMTLAVAGHEARLEGTVRITASVAAHNLLLDDGCLRGFETCYKVLPPLRDLEHIEALREGVKDGTIDAIVSDHRPEDREHKVLEYGPAAFGIIGLETAFAVANTALKGHMTLRRLIERLTHGPRAVLGLPKVHIAEGERAEITLFDPEVNWTCTEEDLVSRSHNTPFLGQRLTGRALGVVCGEVVRMVPAVAGVEV